MHSVSSYGDAQCTGNSDVRRDSYVDSDVKGDQDVSSNCDVDCDVRGTLIRTLTQTLI